MNIQDLKSMNFNMEYLKSSNKSKSTKKHEIVGKVSKIIGKSTVNIVARRENPIDSSIRAVIAGEDDVCVSRCFDDSIIVSKHYEAENISRNKATV